MSLWKVNKAWNIFVSPWEQPYVPPTLGTGHYFTGATRNHHPHVKTEFFVSFRWVLIRPVEHDFVRATAYSNVMIQARDSRSQTAECWIWSKLRRAARAVASTWPIDWYDCYQTRNQSINQSVSKSVKHKITRQSGWFRQRLIIISNQGWHCINVYSGVQVIMDKCSGYYGLSGSRAMTADDETEEVEADWQQSDRPHQRHPHPSPSSILTCERFDVLTLWCVYCFDVFYGMLFTSGGSRGCITIHSGWSDQHLKLCQFIHNIIHIFSVCFFDFIHKWMFYIILGYKQRSGT